ncbi:SRPBCC family protein [Flagellimonas allohymeniacidonis]|uniref:SRPBCC domain-containing protein n=1 Tax=Flagellimonas allohymeniacidonis TaxID=2517819 RepID=A0A4Q8QKM8_9FLAO|nr:SRPBCC domain-containing protein [Allomuricauda hymeniacidonis]TAI48796.1 SRPBCC domain-containing protein [Allomuricauda hymeniacidonis]
MKNVIQKEKVFNHSIDKVWNAISKAEEISSWFIQADFKAEVGYEYTFTSKEEGCVPITGTVKQADPYTLVYTWVVQDTDTETTVKWELQELEGKTKLYLEHSGIANYPAESAVEMFESFNGGWDNCVSLLAGYLTEEVHAG